MYHSMDILIQQSRFASSTSLLNTYDFFHIVPTSKPIISPPEVITEYVEILDGDGAIDLTGKISGSPPLKNREGSWEFIVLPPYDFYETYNKAMKYLHGSEVKVRLVDDDPKYYYIGRLMVGDPKAENSFNYFSLNYIFQPFKEDVISGVQDL